MSAGAGGSAPPAARRRARRRARWRRRAAGPFREPGSAGNRKWRAVSNGSPSSVSISCSAQVRSWSSQVRRPVAARPGTGPRTRPRPPPAALPSAEEQPGLRRSLRLAIPTAPRRRRPAPRRAAEIRDLAPEAPVAGETVDAPQAFRRLGAEVVGGVEHVLHAAAVDLLAGQQPQIEHHVVALRQHGLELPGARRQHAGRHGVAGGVDRRLDATTTLAVEVGDTGARLLDHRSCSSGGSGSPVVAAAQAAATASAAELHAVLGVHRKVGAERRQRRRQRVRVGGLPGERGDGRAHEAVALDPEPLPGAVDPGPVEVLGELGDPLVRTARPGGRRGSRPDRRRRPKSRSVAAASHDASWVASTSSTRRCCTPTSPSDDASARRARRSGAGARRRGRRRPAPATARWRAQRRARAGRWSWRRRPRGSGSRWRPPGRPRRPRRRR